VDGVADPLADQVRFTGQERLIDAQAALVEHFTIDEDLVARTDHEDVVEHDVIGVDGPLLALADDGRGRPHQECDRVELSLRPCLLDDADDDVADHQADRHHRVAVEAQCGQRDTDREEGGIDKGKGVLEDDPLVGAAGFEGDSVRQTLRASLGDLSFAEAERTPDGRGALLGHGHPALHLLLITPGPIPAR